MSRQSSDIPHFKSHLANSHLANSHLAEPRFPGDDGQADRSLVAAGGDPIDLLSVLGQVRLFVAIVPVIAEHATDGSDKSADMAAVLIQGADGRRGLLAFSSVERLTAFNISARPVPVLGVDVARAALAEAASVILLDLASEDFRVIETADVEQLAAGHRLIRTSQGPAWVTA